MDTPSGHHETVRRVKRFKHQSYAESLKDIHVPSALDLSEFQHDIADNESHFHVALQHWRQLNLSPAFIQFANIVDPLSASIPLLLHNWKEIIELWQSSIKGADDEALKVLLDLLRRLAHDLRTTLSPVYKALLERLLDVLSRPLAAPTLTTLLATLSELFRYLLVPSIYLNLLQQTWLLFRSALLNCNPEVQRAAAEVWASVLRRLKTSARDEAVTLMSTNMIGVEDACSWMLVSACKSVSQSLHAVSVPLMARVIDCSLSCEDWNAHYVLLRRTLTALMHHCKGPEQFSDVADVVIMRFCSSVDQTPQDDGGIQRLQRSLQIASIVCGVRQGSRLTSSHLSRLCSKLELIPIHPSIEPTLLSFASSVLVAGESSFSTGPGRSFILRSLESAPTFGTSLIGVLADLEWSGWIAVVQPALCGVTPKLLERAPKETLRLLAQLVRKDKLGRGFVDVAWKRSVDAWVSQRLARWQLTPQTSDDERLWNSQEDVTELRGLLALSTYCEGARELLIDVVERILEAGETGRIEPKEEWEVSHANSAWVLGASMQALAEQLVHSGDKWLREVNPRLGQWTKTIALRWSWSELALRGVAALLKMSPLKENNTVSFTELYSLLQPAILNHSRVLRISALQILSSNLVGGSAGEQDVVRRCLQGEEVSLDAAGVRERVLRIGRVGIAVRDGESAAADLCTRWLMAQLSVNLRPLWSPASEALSALAKRLGDPIWRVMFDELRLLATSDKKSVVPSWLREDNQTLVSDREEERSWRDGAAHRIRGAVAEWLDDTLLRKEIILEQKPLDRFDPSSYEIQLLNAIAQCPSLAEKHNRDVVSLFMSVVGDSMSLSSSHTPTHAIALPRPKLTAWLALFSKFTNPRAMYCSNSLLGFFHNLLAHPNRTIQSAALRCLLLYKSPSLLRHEDGLWRLLDTSMWREELASLDLSSIDPEVADVVIRLSYGLLRERKGRCRGDRRVAVLGVLAACREEDLALLVDLMLSPMGWNSRAWSEGESPTFGGCPTASPVQQIGILNMLRDVLKSMGIKTMRCWPALFGTTMYLVGGAQDRSFQGTDAETPDDAHLEEEVDVEHAGDNEDADSPSEEGEHLNEAMARRNLRTIRQLGLRCLADFFRVPAVFDFTPFLQNAFHAIISPRLAALDKENTQAPSALLEIFALWATRREYVRYLVDFDARVLPKVLDCLVATNVKPSVINLVLGMIECVLEFAAEDTGISDTILSPNLSLLLLHLTTLVERTRGDQDIATPLAQRQIGLLTRLAQSIADSEQAENLLRLMIPLLLKPARVVPERTKAHILGLLKTLIPLIPSLSDPYSAGFARLYESLSRLFLNLRQNTSRSALAAAFCGLAAVDDQLRLIAEVVGSLNACSKKRIDEPDFDCRLAAFTTLNDQLYATLTSRHWLPVLYNALHFLQDADELAIRTNAAFTLRRFVGVVVDSSLTREAQALLSQVVLPSLKGSLRSKSELVCAEVLAVLAHIVSHCTNLSSLQEMQPLLAGGDEEASFFSNIYHVQIHRRTRALRRLGEQCNQGTLSSRILVEVFLPIVEYYVTSTATFDHLLVAEAIHTLGHIARGLRWPAYYSLVQKYLRGSKDKDDSVRVHVRALVAILENFHFSMEDSLPEGEAEDVELVDSLECGPPVPAQREHGHDVGKVSEAVNLRLLPALLGYLSNRDESEDSLRISISLGIAKIAMHLPVTLKEAQVTKLLTTLSQALRSHSQDTRDLVRETMCRIIVMLGPSYFPYAIRELRQALTRGPQLHVLAYVVHGILTHITAPERKEDAFNDLDSCVHDIIHVASEVVFGESWKDVQHEDFKTKMREVRGSAAKGLDIFTLTARHISPDCISALLRPLRAVMEVTTSAKPMQQVDDVLRRIAGGFNSNTRLEPPELLILCHTLISQSAKFLQEATSKTKPLRKGKDDAIVQVKRRVAALEDQYSLNSHRFVVFGLELLHTAFRRSRFDLHDNEILRRLEPFVVLVGNTLYAENGAVIMAALKVMPVILQCSLDTASTSAALVSRQILAIIRSVGSTESEIAQTAFKSLAVVLRDCPNSNIKEDDLLFLLELLTPDLEEPSRQDSAFTLLRAIVARKLVIPEIYDLMTTVSSILVTSQSSRTRESARSLLLQFLLDYPQGSGRLRTTLAFLSSNLSFEHASGRLSVLELLHAIVTKFDASLLAKHAEMLFIALVLCIANDTEKTCRESAASVMQTLVKRMLDEQKKVFVGHLHAWAQQAGKMKLRGVAVQVYGLLINILRTDPCTHLDTILEDTLAVIKASCIEVVDDGTGDTEQSLEWQASYHALQTLDKILHIYPELTTDYSRIEWKHIFALLVFPHAWVRSSANRLLGLLFAAQPSTLAVAEPKTTPLTHENMLDIANRLCSVVKSPHLEEPVALQTVKNLFFVGRWSIAHPRGDHMVEYCSDDGEPEDEHKTGGRKAEMLPWLFSKLSYQARSSHIARRVKPTAVQDNWSLAPLSVFRFFAAMTSHMDGNQVEQFLPHILTPVYRITEEDMIRDAAMSELQTTATELLDLVQAKVGTTTFAAAYNRIRQGALNIRQERRVARAAQAIINPEAFARRTMARNSMKKESRKRKNRAFAESRGQLKRLRKE